MCALVLFRKMVSPWNRAVLRCIQGLVTQWSGACPRREYYCYRGEQDESQMQMCHRMNGEEVAQKGLACNLLGAQARPDVYAWEYVRGGGIIWSGVGGIPRGGVKKLCWKTTQHRGWLRRGFYRQGGVLVVSKACISDVST